MSDAELNGGVTSEADRLISAFVEGAKWWEFHEKKATMWQTDQHLAETTAECRLAAGILGLDCDSQQKDNDETSS